MPVIPRKNEIGFSKKYKPSATKLPNFSVQALSIVDF